MRFRCRHFELKKCNSFDFYVTTATINGILKMQHLHNIRLVSSAVKPPLFVEP